MQKRTQKILSVIIVILISTQLIAQNPLAYGPRAKSMAGAGVANIENSLWGNMNPGGLVFLGQKVGVGIEVQLPTSSFNVIGEPRTFEQTQSYQWPLGLNTGDLNAESKINVIPQIGVNLAIDEDNSIAVSIYGSGNRGVSYVENIYHSSVIAGFGSGEGFINPMGTITSPTFIKLNQYFASLSYSRKIGKKAGVGLSAVGAWQSLNVGGMEAFGSIPSYSEFPDAVSTNGVSNSYGIGAKLGVQWKAMEKLQFGFSYRSKIYMSAFDAYKGLLSESGRLDIPSEWNLGLLYSPTSSFKIALDVNRICHSRVQSWGNSVLDEQAIRFGGEDGGGLGRKDQMSYKIGVQYKIPKWQFRAGFAHSDQSINEDDIVFNILLPEINTDFVSLGLSRKIGKQTVNLALVKSLNTSLIGHNALDSNQEIEISSESLVFEVSVEF